MIGETLPETENKTMPEFEGDPMQYSREFWEEKYPYENICPFYIEENGEEKPYYLIMEYGSTIGEWIETPFNWNGWHKVGDDVVNEDETLKIVDEFLSEDWGFSSFCTVNTEPYQPEETVENA